MLTVNLAYSQINVDQDVDLIADETTIIFRPLFVYKMQQAKLEERQKMREWQKQHPNENYYNHVHSNTRTIYS